MSKYEFTNIVSPEGKSVPRQDYLVDDPQLAEIMAYRTNEQEVELSALRPEVERQQATREQNKPISKERSSRLGRFVAKLFAEEPMTSVKERRFNFIKGKAALRRIDAEVLYRLDADPNAQDGAYQTWREDHYTYRPLKRKAGTAGVTYALAESFKEDDSWAFDRPIGMLIPDDSAKVEDLKQSVYLANKDLERDKALLKALEDGASESDLATEIIAAHDGE